MIRASCQPEPPNVAVDPQVWGVHNARDRPFDMTPASRFERGEVQVEDREVEWRASVFEHRDTPGP
jgi:hypothetical protein